MLNKLLAGLNGSGGDPKALRALLEQLGRDREAALGKIEDLKQKRRQALLDDLSDAEIDKIERAQERAAILVQKIDLALPGVRERLGAAEIAARRAAEPGIAKEYSAVFRDYCEALRKIASAHRAVEAIQAKARSALGDARTNVLLPSFMYAGLLVASEVEMWIDRNAREMLRQIDALANPPPVKAREAAPPAPVERVLARPPAPTGTPQRHGVDSSDYGPWSKRPTPPHLLTASRQPDDTTALLEGECRVRSLRDGWSPAMDRGQTHRGQLVKMPLLDAQLAVRAGVAQIVEGGVEIDQVANARTFKRVGSVGEAHLGGDELVRINPAPEPRG